MTIDQTHPCPKCGQMSLVYDGMLAWRRGGRPSRNLASKDVLLSSRGDQEVERIYHCARCGAEYFEDVETHRVHLWEEGTGKQYLHDATRGWYLRYFDKATNKYIEQVVLPPQETLAPKVDFTVNVATTSGQIQPVSLEVIPNELSVLRYEHVIPNAPPVPCWTYITQGLWAYGQKELVLTVQRDAASIKSGKPFDFLLRPIRAVFDLFKAGKPVDEGAHTALTLVDKERKVGIPFNLLYLHPLPLAGIPLPKHALAVRLMRAEELEVYQTYGAMRLIADWANHWRYFPYPPWSDIPAPDVVSVARYRASILNKAARLHLPASTVCLEEDRQLVWRLPALAKPLLAENLSKLAPECALTFLPGYPDSADACLAWPLGQKQLVMNVPAGSQRQRVAGCFLLFVPEQQAVTIKIIEDGFAVMLPTPAWLQVREALQNGQPLHLPAPNWSLRVAFQPAG